MAWLNFDEKSGRYRIGFRFNGEQYKRSLKTADRREANALRGRIEETIVLIERGRLELPPDVDPATFILSDGKRKGDEERKQRLTLQQLIDRYQAELPKGTKEETTLDSERTHFKHLLRHLKGRAVAQSIAEVEPSIPVRFADTPEECVIAAQDLAQSCDFVVGDAPGGLEDLSRTLLILAARVIFPISPSILDVRSVSQATAVLRYAQGINSGRPEGLLVLNKMRTRDTISQELRDNAPKLGLSVAKNVIRDLQAFRDAAQQGTVVTRFGRKGAQAAADIESLFNELVGNDLKVLANERRQKVGNG